MLFPTMAEELNFRKEVIIMALRGKILVGEAQDEWIFEEASKEACEDAILRAFDFSAYNCVRALDHGRAIERLMEAHNWNWKKCFFEYMAYYDEEMQKSDRYYHYYGEDEFDDEEGE